MCKNTKKLSTMNSNTSNTLPKQPNSLKVQKTSKILVVDDEKFNCEIIDGFLMILGFQRRKEQVVFSYNGE